jgi:tetratricopeptide (TPR) repeat protein
MEKVLKPYTIIPDRLYVPRDADRQLVEIINDMQRPGYVLVSRQMGKTNLLLHAEEKLADKENDIFIYIDLSNSFKDAKDCFENIINTILEVHEEKLQDVAIKIKELRELNSEVAEFMQHIKELRLILGHISGKLVIILDEIDALTKVKYSDIIFTQIRSIYFSRRNIKALNRLTYILSGVVEPKEIIKNQDISPFNIGQKIFLNDFSYDEFLLFIEKSKLKLEKNVIDHIYEWTNGNPRITWDICAEVEQCLSTNVINDEYIDKIVNQIYLTAYDKPPIDNIRQLIKDDSELRNNVKMLLSGSIKNISDRMKNKLYLAGIINYSYDSSEIIIKNKVVKHSIDLKWIKSIEEEDKGLFSLAMELYYRSEFQEALEIFSKFLETNDFPTETKSDGYYFMAFSAYNIPDYNLSMEYLKKTSFTNEDRFYYDANHLRGVLFNHLGDIDASLDSFLLVLKKIKKTEGYLVALSDFGQIALGSKNHKNITDTKNKFLEIADGDFNKGDVTEEFFYKYQAITYYFLALLCIRDNEIEKSRDYFKQSLEFAKDIYKPNIILGLFAVTENAVDKYNLLEMVVNLILEKELIPIEKSELSYHVFDYNMFRTILDLFDKGDGMGQPALKLTISH